MMGVNVKKRWKKWLENFKCCITFDGDNNQPDGPLKKKADLLPKGSTSSGFIQSS